MNPISPKKTALIFGGSRGIGAAIARQLAQDGFWVAITYVSQSEKARQVVTGIEASGGRAMAIQADSADPDAIRRAVRETVDRFGKLDAAIVNAGVLKLANIENVTLDDLDVSLAINVRGVFLAIQAAALNMKDGGRIVTIGSNTAVRTGSSGGSVYAMTKAAVAAMVKGAALDLAPRSITVNNIQPGPTETDMTASMVAGLVNVIPLKRVGQPDEIAALASYLVSEKAGYMTGSSLTIDGGFVL
ncbi:SDR family oxidoreductase [Mycoplana rhizolycopersici]|uniref:SDR family oxidoreductase n=1 Tax=Mycoplana rhizolycopersici TaxID=2746702 RepID=A0ABX2QKG8_9HYPH|nr:SDR family oxidoreductase [Rhizobium rhizolycopersici]NVP58280.1 SDR family oxidoreductase [Rhizobium rhizolycopersici]